MKRDFRKPLVIMSPKSMLRQIAMWRSRNFRIFQVKSVPKREVGSTTSNSLPGCRTRRRQEKVILCSGKVYYDLVNDRTARKKTDTANQSKRIEQLYPWPAP